MGIPLHWVVRRNLRGLLNKVLIKLVSSQANFDQIDPQSINKILLIRLNYRIGNIIFMTPLIRAIEYSMPHIKIDMLVGAGFTKPIIKNMPNVDNVYDAPRSLMKSPIKLLKFVQHLNKNNYDLIISPINGSVSSNIAISLLKAPVKLGIYSEGTYSPLNRFVHPIKEYKHSALRPLALLNGFKNITPIYNKYLDIALSDDEKETGKEYLKKILIKNNITTTTNSKIIAIFRDARNDKKIPNSWWEQYIDNIKQTNSNIIFVDILNPNETAPFIDKMAYIKEKNLRTLGAVFSAFDRFICADTGPMHLASAALTPVIALFNATNPSIYGPLGLKDEVIVINNKSTQEVANATLEIIHKG